MKTLLFSFCCHRGEGGLSPLLFVLAEDVLQSVINDAFRRNLLRASLSVNYNHDYPVVQYVDDTIVILPAQADQLAIMQGIVTNYNA
jgi:hypothetical protein